MTLIDREIRQVPAFQYENGRLDVRIDSQKWDSVEGEDPVCVGVSQNHSVIDLEQVLIDDGFVNEAEGLTITQRNKRGAEAKLAKLVKMVVGSAVIEQEIVIRQKEAEKSAVDDELVVEKTARNKSDDDCAQHVRTIANHEKTIAACASIIREQKENISLLHIAADAENFSAVLKKKNNLIIKLNADNADHQNDKQKLTADLETALATIAKLQADKPAKEITNE